MAAAEVSVEDWRRMDVKDKAKLQLKKFDIGERFSHFPGGKASVLLPLMVKDGKLHLLFTVRSMQLRRSPGDVCFPGGRREPTDKDEIDTALRESQEEIGLHPEQAEVICRLVPVLDKTDSLVTPVVAFIEDTFHAHPNPEEVSDTFSMPLEYFIRPSKYNGITVPLNGIPYLMHTFEYDDPEHKRSFKIVGLTAHIAVFLALAVFGEKPTFEVPYDLENLNSSAVNLFLERYKKAKSKL
ncbi:peroxisomal coenzyme A diphosphatase NUDT7 [Anolis carolinensis]|uniref:Peroxisomal coenzyme A diphosphatase NUDT7 n=1 Tax=Anolis carolinensis TaxID=28377 RepID=H9G667_ANOCA|nr:PREDICTED: peroxisomal coenzyme A diphosphatase NUDT7 [Anolis carolinensis]|eukprot:XP_003227105.1 PREDICTED: peroxisomal coenzyme A diphosphatase NUDT7 [Anolis carolinensis]